MRALHLLLGASLAVTSAWAIAQDQPESLLPPGFDKPAPKPSQSRAPSATAPVAAPAAAGPVATSSPVVQAVPVTRAPRGPSVALPANLPSLERLEAMSPDELDDLLGLRPTDDIPPAARRAMSRVGILDEGEGGLPSWSLGKQNASLVQAVLAGNKGQLVSRWGHILLRRALASRLDAPEGMDPADFAALRAELLVRMGEGSAARAVVQDVDTANYSPALVQAAIDSYVATSDFTGLCPVIALQDSVRKDKPWEVMRAVCSAFSGDGSRAMSQLDRLTYYGAMPRIDMLLAQKYAGAAGKARRAVTIEWNGVKDMTPWRYGMTLATGLEPPAKLMESAGPIYALTAATAPMLSLDSRAGAADVAGGVGVLSSEAMVDLYSQIEAEDDANSEWAGRADLLRDAYLADGASERVSAIHQLWGDDSDPLRRYSRQVLTAYAAARLPVSKDFADDAPDLIASMLAAGLDANGLRWANVVEPGSEGWGLLALAANGRTDTINASTINDFSDHDSSSSRKTRFLIAGLAGLGRLTPESAGELSQKYGFQINRQTRWSRLIDAAAEVGNPTLVALLVGAGMQGDSWDQMTARHLYHIVSALNRVGMGAEARMIAAEAVARG
jgi:hypothetical protein